MKASLIIKIQISNYKLIFQKANIIIKDGDLTGAPLISIQAIGTMALPQKYQEILYA